MGLTMGNPIEDEFKTRYVVGAHLILLLPLIAFLLCTHNLPFKMLRLDIHLSQPVKNSNTEKFKSVTVPGKIRGPVGIETRTCRPFLSDSFPLHQAPPQVIEPF